MEIRTADVVIAANSSIANDIPYPVPEEIEHIQVNKQTVENAAEEERKRRLEEVHSRECESAIVREINIEYAIAAMETERIRRISQHNLAQVHNELVREKSKKDVVNLMEAERGRRMSQGNIALVHDEIIREGSKQAVVVQMEKERHRRMSEDHIAQVHNELLREQFKRGVNKAFETERTRRMSLDSAETSASAHRRNSINKAIELAEEERRVRRTKVGASQNAVTEGSKEAVLPPDLAEQGINESPALVPAKDYPRLPIASSNEAGERKALCELQEMLKDVLPLLNEPEQDVLRNVRLLRFLRGHKGSVEIAATKYREALALRVKHNLDVIRENIILGNMTVRDFPYYEKIKCYIPAVFAHDVHDDLHNVFYFEKLGAVDLYGLAVNVTDDEWLQFCLHDLEYRSIVLDKLSAQHETLVRCTTLRDLDGISVTRITRPVLKRLQNLVSYTSIMYPEAIYKNVFINTPWAFHTAWRGIQLWLNDTQRQKICFLKRGEIQALHAICPVENLPVLMGTEALISYLNGIALGGTNDQAIIPSTGLLGKDSYSLLRDNGATEAEIRARDVLTVPFRVNANDTLCWEFCVLNYDVDFSVKFRTQGDGGALELNVEGWEKSRFVHGQVEAASWTAPSAGAAILCWDNSFSWTRPKTICYKASVAKTIQPDESEAMDISGHGSL